MILKCPLRGEEDRIHDDMSADWPCRSKWEKNNDFRIRNHEHPKFALPSFKKSLIFATMLTFSGFCSKTPIIMKVNIVITPIVI
jgi:hypothetical protein